MRAKYWTVSTFLIASLFLVSASSRAQNLNASISGTVTDPTGAVVPKAELSLTGVATGVATKVTTGPDGLFSFPNLQPGAYSLKASAQGFRDFLQSGITLNVNQKVRVDVRLMPSETTGHQNQDHKEGR